MLIPPKTKNESSPFTCELCHYTCAKKFLLTQHKKTKKHQNAYMLKKCSKKYAQHICCCGKKYKHIQSYNRHIKTCNVNENNKDELKDILKELIKQNQSILKEHNDIRTIVKDIIPHIGNTTINNQFNLNVFLNDECKDALNLTEFVNTLSLDISDLAITRTSGYTNGIANIFLKGLKALDMNKRPIHCSDLKREILYVKDNNNWEKENTKKEKINNAIAVIAKKQINEIKNWERMNPDWKSSEKSTIEYCDLIREITSCKEDISNKKIIKKIAKEVIIQR